MGPRQMRTVCFSSPNHKDWLASVTKLSPQLEPLSRLIIPEFPGIPPIRRSISHVFPTRHLLGPCTVLHRFNTAVTINRHSTGTVAMSKLIRACFRCMERKRKASLPMRLSTGLKSSGTTLARNEGLASVLQPCARMQHRNNGSTLDSFASKDHTHAF